MLPRTLTTFLIYTTWNAARYAAHVAGAAINCCDRGDYLQIAPVADSFLYQRAKMLAHHALELLMRRTGLTKVR
jgi:hypothetical protein